MNLNPIAVFSVIQVPFPRTENWLFVDLIFQATLAVRKQGRSLIENPMGTHFQSCGSSDANVMGLMEKIFLVNFHEGILQEEGKWMFSTLILLSRRQWTRFHPFSWAAVGFTKEIELPDGVVVDFSSLVKALPITKTKQIEVKRKILLNCNCLETGIQWRTQCPYQVW